MTRPLLLLAALLFAPIACGDEDDDDNDTGNDAGSNTNGESGTTNPSTTSSTSSSMEVCDSSHQCLNGVCQCTTPGLENQPCTDDTACEEECEICM